MVSVGFKRAGFMKKFSELVNGDIFTFNGTMFKKKSSSTAFVYGRPNRWFYFSKNDMVSHVITEG